MGNVRITSKLAYRYLLDSGKLGQRHAEIFKTVYTYGPCTSAEAFEKMTQGKYNRPLSQSRARFTELRRMGLLEECGKAICRVTGRKAIVWRVPKILPAKPNKKAAKRSGKYIEGWNDALSAAQKLILDMGHRDNERRKTHFLKIVFALKDLYKENQS